MSELDAEGRPEPPWSADEVDSLTGFLDYQRATLTWKTAGLDAEQFRRTTATSSMTLGGLLKHLAFVESYWFTHRLLGEPPREPFRGVDWDAEPDWDWRSAHDDTPEQLRTLWIESVEASRDDVRRALADGGLDRPLAIAWPDGTTPSLRWVMLHMIEEYARHNGHADLLREFIDGQTGE